MIVIKGIEFYPDFFKEDGSPKLEEAIESIFNLNHMKATEFGVEVTKESAPLRGRTDGYCKVFDKCRNCKYYGLQECKRNIKRTQCAYAHQIVQGLLYFIQFKSDVRFIIYPSTNYVDYIIINENKDLIETNRDMLLNALRDGSPSEACKTCQFPIYDLHIHRVNLPDPCELSSLWTEIMDRCAA